MSTKKLITMTECAAIIGVSVRTVQSWIHAGKMKGVYTGAKKQRARFVTQAEVNRILKGGVR